MRLGTRSRLGGASLGGRWALIKISVDQASVDDDVLLDFDTVVKKSGTFTVGSTGIITLAAGNWELWGSVQGTFAAAHSAALGFYTDPAGTPAAFTYGQAGSVYSTTFSSSDIASMGLAGQAYGYIEVATTQTVGLICSAASGAFTATAAYSKLLIREVKQAT